MSEENDKKFYRHLKNVINGKYSTERFEKKDLGEENNLDGISNALMISDATLNLAELIRKRPKINFEESEAPEQEEEPVEEEPVAEKKTKSKGKR